MKEFTEENAEVRVIKCSPEFYNQLLELLQADERFVPADTRVVLVLFTPVSKRLTFVDDESGARTT